MAVFGKVSSLRRMLLVCGPTVCAFISVDATAQVLASADNGDVLQEITVTAERRSENQQTVPVAITSLSAEQLVTKGVSYTDQLSAVVPGLQVTREVNDAAIFIRGVGPQAMETGEEGSTAVYIDDLYVPQGAAALFQLTDIESIQVLKGPQGTLFGRNATAGVVQIRTKNPTDTPALDAHIGYANYNTTSGDIYLTGKLTDTLSGNLAAYGYDERQGWGRDLYTGERAFTETDSGIRSKLLWTPTADTRVLLTGGYNSSRGEVGVGLNQVPGSTGCCGNGYVGFYNNTDAQNDGAWVYHTDIQMRIEQNLGWANLVNIAGYLHLGEILKFNQDDSPAAVVMNVGHQFGTTWSDELQLLSPESSKVKWIAGLYYLHDRSGYDPAALSGLAFGFPSPQFPSATTDWVGAYSTIRTTSYAGYGQATYEILPKTNLTGGVRYTDDKKDATAFEGLSPSLGGAELNGDPCPSGVGLCPYRGAKTFTAWTYRAVLDHHFRDDLMGYFSFNRGFKSGEYDTVNIAFAGPTAEPPVKPEFLNAYELGFKSEFLDHRLQINAAAFYYDYTNIQFTTVLTGFTLLLNAASATIKGGELEITALPLDHLTVSANLAVIDGHYNRFDNASCYVCTGLPPATPPGAASFNASGYDTVRSPRYTNNLTATYTIPTDRGRFALTAAYTYIDSFEWNPDQELKQPVTNLLSASLLWTSPSGKWDARLWGANLAGAKYYAFADEGTGLGLQFSPEAPRTYGLTLGLHL